MNSQLQSKLSWTELVQKQNKMEWEKKHTYYGAREKHQENMTQNHPEHADDSHAIDCSNSHWRYFCIEDLFSTVNQWKAEEKIYTNPLRQKEKNNTNTKTFINSETISESSSG